MTQRNVLLITHTQYIDGESVNGPVDTIKDYLIEVGETDVQFVSLAMTSGGYNKYTRFESGKENRITNTSKTMRPGIAKYLIDIIFVIKTIKSKDLDIAVAADPLNYFYLKIILFFKRISADRKYYYTLDYAKNRFDNRLMNNIYHYLDRAALADCDLSLNAARNINDLRVMQGIDVDKLIYVPNSPLVLPEIESINDKETIKIGIVFSRFEDVEFGYILGALYMLLEKECSFFFTMIGKGKLRKDVSDMINTYCLHEHVKYCTPKDHNETLLLISQLDIGIEANTETRPDNAYRDPIKIREYIAFGLVTITKPGHAIVNELVDNQIGHVANTATELYEILMTYISNKNLLVEMKSRVVDYSKKDSKKNIIDSIFLL